MESTKKTVDKNNTETSDRHIGPKRTVCETCSCEGKKKHTGGGEESHGPSVEDPACDKDVALVRRPTVEAVVRVKDNGKLPH